MPKTQIFEIRKTPRLNKCYISVLVFNVQKVKNVLNFDVKAQTTDVDAKKTIIFV